MNRSRTPWCASAVVLVLALGASVPVAAADPLADARAAYLNGRYHDAVSVLRPYLVRNPESADAWAWLGASLARLERWSEAVRAFEWAYRLKPSTEMALWLGAAYARVGRDAEARRYLRPVADGHGYLAAFAGQWVRALQGRTGPALPNPPNPHAYARVVRWYNNALTASQVDAIVRSVLFYSDYYKVDPRLVMALITIESGFHITAQSPAGAYGLGQLMPETWRQLGVHPADPVANVYATVRVLKGNLERLGSDYSLALAAYNAGHGAVERYSGIPPYQETQWYVYNVLTVFRHLAGEQGG